MTTSHETQPQTDASSTEGIYKHAIADRRNHLLALRDRRKYKHFALVVSDTLGIADYFADFSGHRPTMPQRPAHESGLVD